MAGLCFHTTFGISRINKAGGAAAHCTTTALVPGPHNDAVSIFWGVRRFFVPTWQLFFFL